MELETDSKVLIALLESNSQANHPSIKTLLRDIKSLASEFLNCRFFHVFREANFVADSIANWAVTQEPLVTWWYTKAPS
ncbi:reverse transcriptase-like protein, partial [Salmonella enterica subsp. enterica serovar 1,4,[5],12:i:-]|nr:reverse transcriptase-like protein [Salmonella enterica subsp. enterica serovar 1,4,[5],12:i:-]